MPIVPDAVARVFSADVLGALAAIKRPPSHRFDHLGEPVRQRHIMFAGDEIPGRAMSALREAWWKYIWHADAVGLFDDDLLQRLRSLDDDDFRGALAECRTSWFFDEKLGVKLRRHQGAGGDFDDGGQLRVEVKAPYVPLLSDASWGDDSDVLANCIKKAGKQFDQTTTNIVVICPLLRTPVRRDREQLVTACIGEWAISVPIPVEGRERGEAKPVFLQTGKLAKILREGGTFSPHHRRVSAVATIEEEVQETPEGLTIRHEARVIHNPFAKAPLPETMFAGNPQFVLRGREMSWVEK